MKHYWAFLFLLVPILGLLTVVLAPNFNDGLPPDVSENGRAIDRWFIFLLYVAGISFVFMECALCYSLWHCSGRSSREPRKSRHGSRLLKAAWTILPTFVFLLIAVYQVKTLADAQARRPDVPITAEVTGRQFRWDVRYPGADGLLHTPDDMVCVDGDIHLPSQQEVLLVIKSGDVLHRFSMPNLRILQDVAPGTEQYVWFMCREPRAAVDMMFGEPWLWGASNRKGLATFEPDEDFKSWLTRKAAEQNAHRVPEPPHAE